MNTSTATIANDNYAKVSHEVVILDRHGRPLGYLTRVLDWSEGKLSMVVPGWGRLSVERTPLGQYQARTNF